MTVYFAFVPNSAPGTHSLVLEHAPNLAVPERALAERARTLAGRTYHGGVVYDTEQPHAEFPTADMSAFLLIWRRTAGAGRPVITEQPDELWSLSPRGTVLKDRTSLGAPQDLPRLPERPRAESPRRPRSTRPRPLPPRSVWAAHDAGEDVVVVRDLVAPLRPACPSCDRMPRADGRCGCS